MILPESRDTAHVDNRECMWKEPTRGFLGGCNSISICVELANRSVSSIRSGGRRLVIKMLIILVVIQQEPVQAVLLYRWPLPLMIGRL